MAAAPNPKEDIEPMPDSSLNERDAKLVQWLNEAYAKEAELEADLTAHITLTQKASYKKRLQKHLTETRDHKRKVASRIRKLGGDATSGPNLPGVPEAVGEVAGKAVAAVKGQVGAARAVITNQPETHLRNAQEELREEHVEIALYSRIITLAEAVGDRETAQLAKAIRRDEERMAKFLDAELARLVKDVVRAEIPRSQRATTTRRRARRASSGTRRSSSRSRSGSGARSASRSGTSSRSSSSSRSSGSRSGGSRSTGSRSTGSRSGGSRSSGSRSSGSRSSSARSSGTRSASSSRRTSGSSSRNSASGTSRSRSTGGRSASGRSSGGSSRSRSTASSRSS
jgi:ferritin-like metal-binding protein YciE